MFAYGIMAMDFSQAMDSTEAVSCKEEKVIKFVEKLIREISSFLAMEVWILFL